MVRMVGLDIGGANLKAADADGRTAWRALALWKAPQRLAGELAELLRPLEPYQALAVTMTAELADCFRTKAEGVHAILRAVEAVAAGRPVHVWQTGGEFVPTHVACEIPLLVAAANWHALATWVGRLVPDRPALLIDIGSTTADIIPLSDGVPVPTGLTDSQRLQSGELVYSGVRRTPVCAVAHSVPLRGGYCPLAAELFATTLDVYLTLGDIAGQPDCCETANGRPATRAEALDRLARAVCCDCTEFTAEDATVMARFLADVQRQRIAGAIDRVLRTLGRPCESVVISGSGTFLAERIVGEHPRLKAAQRTVLASLLDERTSAAACALAVARLAEERGVL